MSDFLPTNTAEFKDSLRRELIFFKELKKALEKEDYETLKEKIQSNIERIESSLQD